ncbi:serine/threonine-protein kinase ppk6 [Sarocladium implicatum]|nr:serine/threonine-protein kinase ppk6 [Sarocladium implicatum]
MSADLFAEFNELSQSPAPKTLQPSSEQPATQSQNQPGSSGHDPFGSLQNFGSDNATFSLPQQQWSSFSAGTTDHVSLTGNQPSPASQAPLSGAADDDDDWGDFETSDPKSSGVALHPEPISQWVAPQPNVQWQNPGPQQSISWQAQKPTPIPTEPKRLNIVRADTMELISNSLVSVEDRPRPEPAPSIREEPQSPPQRPRLRQGPSDPNVLFDAGDFELEGGGDGSEEDEDEDDFGDFETVAPAPSQPTAPARPAARPAPPSLDLLGLSLDEPSQSPAFGTLPAQKSSTGSLLSFGSTAGSYPMAPKSPSYQQRTPFPELAIKTPVATEFDKNEKEKSPSPVTAWPSFGEKERKSPGQYHDDDEWGAWDDMPSGGGKTTSNVDTSGDPKSWDWNDPDETQPAATKIADDAPPPVNVPPPSVILSIFPDLFATADKLFKPMAGQGSSIKDRVLSDSKVIDFLQGYILLATTAAHIIAGRKHRWHRDKILAKSMSISAAGSKGMKLAGVDKTQSAREDREAADVVMVWKDHVGRLRSAVAAANTAGKASFKVPELSESMQVQTAKMAPTALKACVVCGLKREERVSKVDVDIEDSFGEWWVEHWGHRACKNFWIEHEQKLRQR